MSSNIGTLDNDSPLQAMHLVLDPWSISEPALYTMQIRLILVIRYTDRPVVFLLGPLFWPGLCSRPLTTSCEEFHHSAIASIYSPVRLIQTISRASGTSVKSGKMSNNTHSISKLVLPSMCYLILVNFPCLLDCNRTPSRRQMETGSRLKKSIHSCNKINS